MPKEGDDAPGAKLRWHEEQQKRKQQELERLGLDESQAYRLETAEVAQAKYRKEDKKKENADFSMLHPKDNERVAKAFDKLSEKVGVSREEYEALKASDPEFYRDADSLQYGKAPPVSQEHLDRMVAELNEKRNAAFSRRRAYNDAKDIDYINRGNARFNQSIDRSYSKFTQEIKANLERGTALPDR